MPRFPGRPGPSERPSARVSFSGGVRKYLRNGSLAKASARVTRSAGAWLALAANSFFEPFATFFYVTAYKPKPPQADRQAQAGLRAGRPTCQRPAQSMTKVVVLQLQAAEPGDLFGTDQLHLGTPGQFQEIVQVAVSQRGGLARTRTVSPGRTAGRISDRR